MTEQELKEKNDNLTVACLHMNQQAQTMGQVINIYAETIQKMLAAVSPLAGTTGVGVANHVHKVASEGMSKAEEIRRQFMEAIEEAPTDEQG